MYREYDFLSSRLFLYTLAAVCTTWNVILLVPDFWTQVIILIDSDLLSHSDFRSQLESFEKKKNPPIDVLVSMRAYTFAGREGDEICRVRNFFVLTFDIVNEFVTMSFILPHFQ